MPLDTETHGIDFLLKGNTNLIGGATDATLTQTVETTTTATKDGDLWGRSQATIRSWEITSDALYIESSSKITGQTGTFSVGISSDGGSSHNDLQGLESATLNLAMDLAQITSADTSGWVKNLYNTRSVSLDVEVFRHDPAGSGATAESDIQDVLDGTEDSLDVKLSFGANAEFTFTATVDTNETNANAEDAATDSLTFTADGSVTNNTTSEDSGLSELLSAYFGDPPVTVTALWQPTEEGSSTSALSGATQYTGEVWVTDLSLTIPNDDDVTHSVTLTGDGALTNQTQ